eukprot:CAMPEP_0173231934 /NCGR_PEP_ID=MMETSP1142-20121109/8675_1 /TAXON_ID=483371 /ORGANISM="non described non described, Strain CCMP2298" /LENGTH=43 /DNA_ID= /DNA_START= /DNA_END= /DNA_ORIENTATION=
MESRVLGAAETAADTGLADRGSSSGRDRTYLPSKRVDFKRFKE